MSLLQQNGDTRTPHKSARQQQEDDLDGTPLPNDLTPPIPLPMCIPGEVIDEGVLASVGESASPQQNPADSTLARVLLLLKVVARNAHARFFGAESTNGTGVFFRPHVGIFWCENYCGIEKVYSEKCSYRPVF